ESASRAPEIALAHRLSGLTRWFEGNLVEARRHLEVALGRDEATTDRDFLHRFGQDIASPAMLYLALVLWLTGTVDRARALAADAVARAIATGHAPTIAYAHAHAVILAMLGRNRGAAAPHVAALHALAEKHGMMI